MLAMGATDLQNMAATDFFVVRVFVNFHTRYLRPLRKTIYKTPNISSNIGVRNKTSLRSPMMIPTNWKMRKTTIMQTIIVRTLSDGVFRFGLTPKPPFNKRISVNKSLRTDAALRL